MENFTTIRAVTGPIPGKVIKIYRDASRTCRSRHRISESLYYVQITTELYEKFANRHVNRISRTANTIMYVIGT